jgi:hypothetical protein
MTEIDWKNASGRDINAWRDRYTAGEPISDEDEAILRDMTSGASWMTMVTLRRAALALRIVPGKSDIELAQEYRQKLLDLLEPVTVVINEARRKGLIISFGYSPPDAFGRQSLAQLDINKKLA